MAHPFFSLLIGPRVFAHRPKLDPTDPRLDRVVDAYLEVWGDYGGRPEMREAFALARRLAVLNRTLTWHSVLSAVSPEERGEDADSAASWLHEWLSVVRDA